MNEHVIERAGAVNAARLLQQIEKWLIANGYTVSARSEGELNLVSAAAAPHRLSVSANTLRTRFAFTPAAPRATLPEAGELERRVDASLGQVSAAAPVAPRPASGGGRCSICATVIPAGALECPTCGMPVS